jgi:microcin C transport system permease protein
MKLIQFSPLALKQINRFKSIKRGYYSFLFLSFLVMLTLVAELLINNRALFVSYNGQWHFPTYGDVLPGKTFGYKYAYETNYRKLQKKLKSEKTGFVLLPLVPYNAYENDFREGVYPPTAPSFEDSHYLGTDTTGRDVLARLFYGFRIAIFFSLLLLVCNYTIGVSVGSAMGFLGGRFDMIMQRLIEIWSNIPFLYVVIIVASIITPNLYTLMGIMLFFGWMGMTWQMRTTTYKERAREYVMAAQSLGASRRRIIFNHILPNSIFIIVSFIPFSISGGIVALTSLDYLGFGLPPPTASWGELLRQGTNNLGAGWIVSSVVIFMIFILVMVTFIGEAVREAFDPKKHTTYE